jgi:hypothetical protein
VVRVTAYRDLLHEHIGVPTARRITSMRDALEFVAGVIAGPVTEPYPQLTPATWQAMNCRAGRRCHCDFCQWEERNRKRVLDWERAQAMRPQEQHPLPFGSVADALTRYVHWRVDGAALESSSGRQLDTLRDQAASGVRTQRSGRADRDPRAAFLAGRAIDVERSLVRAYQPAERRRGVGTHACIRVLLASVVQSEFDVEGWAAKMAVPATYVVGIVKDGRKAVLVDLAAREVVPMPTRPAELVREVEAARVELERRRVG